MYFENLNSLLRKLSFFTYTGQILKDLDSVVDWIDYGNEHLFAPIGYKFTLYLFYNSYRIDEDEDGDFNS